MIAWIELDEADLTTIYGIAWSKNMQPGDVSTPGSEEYVAYDADNYADYILEASDAASPKKYVVTIPEALVNQFSHMDFSRRAGASPATTDTREGTAARAQADVLTVEGDPAQQAIADAVDASQTGQDLAEGGRLSTAFEELQTTIDEANETINEINETVYDIRSDIRYPVTIYVFGDDDLPIENARVEITADLAGLEIVDGPDHTDANGAVFFRLPRGTYYVWRAPIGESFSLSTSGTYESPQILVVS